MLEAQAEMVFWWDTQAKKREVGRPTKNRNPSVTILVAGVDGLPDKMTISRWRKRLVLPEAFERGREPYRQTPRDDPRRC